MYTEATSLVWGALHRLWYVVPLFLCLAFLLIWSFFVSYKRVQKLVHLKHLAHLLPGSSRIKMVTRLLLKLCALLFLSIALLQPQWGKKEIVVEQEGRDVLILLDISRSMQAKDLKPSRLDFVKLKLRKLVSQMSFERIGLILFSGSAFVQCPLTADYKTFLMYLNHVTTESVSSGTTAIGASLRKAIEVFNRSKNRKNKLVLLVTDGEDFASDTAKMKKLIEREGITLFAWGAGSEQGAPIPVFNAQGVQVGNEKDAKGAIALTKLNEQLLQQLSQEMGGSYERITLDNGDVARTIAKISAFETEILEGRKLSEYHDRYPLFLGLSWVCLLLEWVL